MRLKIYYLDDEQEILELFEDTFSLPEREITTFTAPEVAIEVIRKNPPDILFIDYRLPNYSGEEVAKMIDPGFPKVLVTGEMEVKSKYPFFSIIGKPWKKNQIELILNNLKNSISR
jgi:DNA-binding NtrC family response regulator